ncbi:MAG: DUF1398 domain-containing protein [Variovorax paradoxus]|uniref:DUF1398 domain-containing protein n=1 Tax=Variovorax paradoxus TaxID=34073 RepID=A0A2W5QBE9_VARPD|nr:MAG: DUF1398 domain-containing protein [Variovorax paradoxus]
MNPVIESVIRHTAEASDAGRIHFGEVVAALVGVGVESYAVDYRGRRITYYLPDGTTLTLEQHAPDAPIADTFDAEAVRAAIRGAQRGEVMYPAFKRLTQAAGCVGYTVWIAGRHVTYQGRRGETHVERFPD